MKLEAAQSMRAIFLCLALLPGVIIMSTSSQKASAAPPFYADKQNLLNYIDDQGVTHSVNSRADWEKRRAHIMANMLLVMGEMPDENKRVPLDVEVLEDETEIILRNEKEDNGESTSEEIAEAV